MGFMANLGSFASGAVKGDLEAKDELRRQEQQRFLEEQQAQQRQEWQREQAFRDRVKGLQRPGTYTVPTGDVNNPSAYVAPGSETGADGQPAQQTTVTVTPDQFMQNMAGAIADYKPELAGGMYAQALQFKNAQRLDQQAQRIQDAGAEYARELAELHANPAKKIPELQQRFHQNLIGGPKYDNWTTQYDPQTNTITAISPDGKTRQQFDGTQAGAQLLHDQFTYTLGSINPEFMYKNDELGIKRGQLDVMGREADTRDRLADSTINVVNPAQAQELRARAGYYGFVGAAMSGKYDHGWVPLGTDADNTPVFYDAKKFDPRNPAASFARADGQPIQNLKALYPKLIGGAGAGKNPTALKFVNDGNGGYFSYASDGEPMAYPDPQRQFPYIPIGSDPRADKSVMGQLRGSGVKLNVIHDPQSGMPMWGYQSKDGRMWSSPQEAINPPAAQTGGGAPAPAAGASAAPATPRVGVPPRPNPGVSMPSIPPMFSTTPSTDPNYPGGQLNFNWLPTPAAPVANPDPSKYPPIGLSRW